MFIYGITSSIFDLITFWLLYKYFSVNEAQFRTGWFMESLATQILVVFIIRTQHTPFYTSKPSRKLIFSVAICLFIGWLLPYLPFAGRIGFEVLPIEIVLFIIALVFVYLISAEFVKRFIYMKPQKVIFNNIFTNKRN
jgi:Mg2+-importing ATPase